jgi:hypothetical protein
LTFGGRAEAARSGDCLFVFPSAGCYGLKLE